MAYTKRRRNFPKRKFQRRKRNWSSRKKRAIVSSKGRYDSNRNFPFNFFPNSYTARLRYVEEINMNPGVGATTVHVFRANCCYDPNFTGVGHQPKGFDEGMNMYDHFTVVGSKITVQDVPYATTVTNPGYFGIYLSDDGSSVAGHASTTDLLESRTTGRFAIAGLGAASGHGKTITRSFSTKKFFRKKQVVGDSLYRGTSAASPTEQAYFEVWCSSCDGNDPGTQHFRVTIDYFVVFTERKYLGPS